MASGRSFTAIVTLLVAGVLVGCRLSSAPMDYPRDPLLLARKPMEPAPRKNAALVAQAEPLVPTGPPITVARVPRLPEPGRLPQPELVTSAKRPADDEDLAVLLTGQGSVAGCYGHAADFSWLQGILERHSRNHFMLRYAEPSPADRSGGIICLANDPRLDPFKDGDMVFVQGSLIARPSTGAAVGELFPCYRIRIIWPVQLRN